MDAFLRALLVEHQLDDCITFVVDNARLHIDSWSTLPHQLGNNPTLKSDPARGSPQFTKRRNQRARQCGHGSDSLEDPCTERWGTAAHNNAKTKEPALKPTAAPAPPSCPQRQKSIEVTPQDWASMNNSPSSVLDSLAGEVPRMPKRQASVSLPSTCVLPPPPMVVTHMNTLPPMASPPPPPPLGMSESSVSHQSENILFANARRSRASLLDDDESDDEESNAEEDKCNQTITAAALRLGRGRGPSICTY